MSLETATKRGIKERKRLGGGGSEGKADTYREQAGHDLSRRRQQWRKIKRWAKADTY